MGKKEKERIRFNVPPNTTGHIGDGFFTGQMTQPTVSKHGRKRGNLAQVTTM